MVIHGDTNSSPKSLNDDDNSCSLSSSTISPCLSSSSESSTSVHFSGFGQSCQCVITDRKTRKLRKGFNLNDIDLTNNDAVSSPSFLSNRRTITQMSSSSPINVESDLDSLLSCNYR